MLTNDRFSKSILEYPKMDKKNVQFSKSHCTFEAKKRKFTMWGLFGPQNNNHKNKKTKYQICFFVHFLI